MRVGARNELPGHDEPLLGKVEMKNAVTGRGVVRPLDVVQPRKLAADCGLLVVVFLLGEDEVVVGDRRLPWNDRPSASDLVERMDGERRRAVRRRQQIGVYTQRGARRHLSGSVDAMRPHDLLGGGHRAGLLRIRPFDSRRRFEGRSELAAAGREDAAGLTDFVFLRRQWYRRVRLALCFVRQAP